MGHNRNLRSSQQMMEPEVPSPSPSVGVGVSGDVMESGPQQRALGNEYILKELFSHLSVEDLNECRLVNQLWNQVAIRVLPSKAPVLEFTGKEGIPRLEKFMDTFKNIENTPYRKFKVSGWILYEASPEQQLVLPKFVEKIAPIVTHLGVRCGGSRLFPRRKPKKRTEFPRLKSLELPYTSLKSDEEFMINVLQHSPNLDTITILNHCRPYYNVDQLIKNVPWTKIRHLKLEGDLKDNHFQKILELGAGLKLKSFELVAGGLRSGTAFLRFLDGQSGSLEELKLQFEFWSRDSHSDFRLPGFPKLKTMEMNFNIFYSDSSANDMYGLLAVPSFSQRFPALNSVRVTGNWLSKLCGFLRSEGSAPVETVKTLKFELSYDVYRRSYTVEQEKADKRHVIAQLCQVFPNIRKLVIPADVVITRAIESAHGWQNLKDLTLICGKSRHADYALIGLDKAEFLKNLETLELDIANDVSWYDRKTYFSDLSCHLVLLKLGNPKCLDLCGLTKYGRVHHQVTKPMIEEMSAKFNVLYKEGKPKAE